MTRVVGYSFNEGTFCEGCTMDYAREVPYSEYDFQEYGDEDITSDHNPGMFNMVKAIELEVIKDSENNPIHPIFSTDEAGDSPDNCASCGELIDNSWSGSTVNYAVEQLRTYVMEYMDDQEASDVETMDGWAEHMHGCILETQDERVLLLYDTARDDA
jgi:hypothetical protein